MKKKVFLWLFISISALATAQTFSRKMSFYPEWTVGANAGINYYMGEGVIDFIKILSIKPVGFNANGFIGYQFTPLIGVRANIGISYLNYPFDTVMTSFRAENLNVDCTFDLTNALLGYKKNRPLNMLVFAGTGMSLREGIGSNATLYIFGKGGLQANIPLQQFLMLHVSGEVNVVGDSFNGNPITGSEGNNKFDLLPAFSVGISYRIPSTKRILYKTKKYYGFR